MSEFIHETENFGVVISPMVSESTKGIIGYGVINKNTQVREQETNVEAMAIRLLHRSEKYRREVLMDPEDKAGEAEAAARQARMLGHDMPFGMED